MLEQETSLYHQSIFGSERAQAFGYSNVHRVFERASGKDVVDFIGRVYAPRCLHLPDTAQTTGVIVSEPSNFIKDHYGNYLGPMFSTDLSVHGERELNGHMEGALVVPFINTTLTERDLKSHGMEVWGLPGKLVDVLKNKADTQCEFSVGFVFLIEERDHQKTDNNDEQ